MRIKYSNALFIILIMLLGGIYINNATHTASAVGSVSAEIKPGNTIWYSLDKFTNLQDFVDEADTGTTISGSLVGSQIYVKILNIQKESMSFWDGSTLTSTSLPTIDIATGLILSDDITVTVTDPTNSSVSPGGVSPETVTLPKGSGFPVPISFGTVTQFNVSGLPDLVAPVPLVLNDDYALHETVLNQGAALAEVDGVTVTVTSDANELKVQFSYSDTDGSVSGSVSWRKSDGLLTHLDFSATDNTTSKSFDIEINLVEVKFEGLEVNVGDEFKLSLEDIGFLYSLKGFSDATEQQNLADELDAVKSELESYKGTTLIDLTVKEVSGLYYRVDGTVFDPDTQEQVQLSEITDGVDIWMNGFGTFDYSYFRLLLFAGLTSSNDYGSSSDCYYDSYGNYVCTTTTSSSSGPSIDNLTPAELRRLISIPGMFITKDWDIYSSWHKTVSSSVATTVDAIKTAPDFPAGAKLDASFGAKVVDGAYEMSASVSWDVTDTSGTSPSSTSGNAKASMKYDKYGTFEYFKASGSGKLTSDGATIEISNAKLVVSSDTVLVNPRTDAATGGESPGVGVLDSLPGFNFYLALGALMLTGVLVRKRKY